VQLAVDELREQIDARLTLRHVELRPVEREKTFGDGLELLRVRHERLHLLLATERTKSREHLLDRGWNGLRRGFRGHEPNISV
jgi:hypothetical protein